MIAPTDLILVALMPNPRDMEIARVLGWYRIPLASAPRVVSVDYLAFYQPASFKQHKWQIEWIAPVVGHELVTRIDLLKDEPNHPRYDEEYYKIQLGPLEKLPTSIPAVKNWKRITFLYTTGERLQNAANISDLGIYDEERKTLWRALRERAKEKQTYKIQELPEDLIDPELLKMFGTVMLLPDVEDILDEEL